MTLFDRSKLVLCICLLICLTTPAQAQGSKTDYERADQLSQLFRNKITNQKLTSVWVGKGQGVWYRKDLGEGKRQWMSVDFAAGKEEVAFNHEQFAKLLAEYLNRKIDPLRLPFDVTTVSVNGVLTMSTSKGGSVTFDTRSGEFQAWSSSRNAGKKRQAGASPDGRWIAQVKGHNLVLYALDENGIPDNKKPMRTTTDGVESDAYINQIYWSPDSSKIVAMKRQTGDSRYVTIIDSRPDKQIQPKTQNYFYRKPGDKVDIDRPILFDAESMQQLNKTHDLAPNPFKVGGVRWEADSRAFTYEYNQRGHQAYRVIEVDAKTGTSRAVIDESSKTFITHYHKKYLHDLGETDEMIWMSERDGWNHLYLYDSKAGKVKRQITKGRWVVRSVDRVDEENRTIWFWAGGIHKGQDPYYLHYCRADLDTGEVTALTASNGTHSDVMVSLSGKYLTVTWSRVDHAPVHELRSAETGELIEEIARADASKLVEAGWVAPEPFVAKGRDGKTDIYGIIIKPTNFDPKKKYPVIEQIYAGPHDSHVPKAFRTMRGNMRMAELGFIVVQIDGMGTSNRSKAFHDVCYKNLKDAGFPDRIAWMKAAANDRPWMDLSRVGIYGGSAGGQNAMRAVLDHADFYKAAAADCGCHDNRMDKIWWNEQWMGWPVDQSYIDSSNVEDAHKLGGKLLLTVGELDKNVDPASTMQVVDALIKANKDFEFMVFPGGGHGAGESPYGQRLRADFFVRHLHGKTPRW